MIPSSLRLFSDSLFLMRNHGLDRLTPQQLKITAVVLAVLGALVLVYKLVSSFLASPLESSAPKPKSESILSPSILASPLESSVPKSKSESILSPSIIDSVKSSTKELPPIPYKAHIALMSRVGGLVGPDMSVIPEEIHDWQLKDGSPLLLKEDTLLLKFMFFHPTKEFEGLVGPRFEFYLPSFLFDEAKEGGKIQLRYKGKLVELQVDQHEIIKGYGHYVESKGNNFEEIFKVTVQDNLKGIKEGDLGFSGALFGIYQPLEGYTLDFGGELYHSLPKDKDDPAQGLKIVKAKPEDFRKVSCLNERDKRKVVFCDESLKSFSFRCAMVGIKDQVDIVVNEKFLCFYGKSGVIAPGLPPFEFLYILLWKKYFEHLSLDEMKNHINNASTTLAAGIFSIEINGW